MRSLHSEIGASMLDEHIVLFETAGIKQFFQPLPGGKFAFGVLRFDAFFSSAKAGSLSSGYQLLDFFFLNVHTLFFVIFAGLLEP